MADEELEKLASIIQSHCNRMAEHFDSVQIVATAHGDGDSHMLHFGQGNGYARTGSVRDWLLMCDAKTRADGRKEMDDG